MKLLLFIPFFLQTWIVSVWAGEDVYAFAPNPHVILSCLAEGSIASYRWTLVTGPGGSVISNPTQPVTTVGNMKEGVYSFRIRVFDSTGLDVSDTVKVTIYPKEKRLKYSIIKMID